MPRFVMIVQSQAHEGRDSDYNTWYDNEHLSDIMSLPGVTSGRRFDFEKAFIGAPGLPYLAIYEIETDDVLRVVEAMEQHAATGTMSVSNAVDGPASVLWFYKERC